MDPVFIKSDCVLSSLLLLEEEGLIRGQPHGATSNFQYQVVMAWLQDVCIEQHMQDGEAENNTLLGIEFWQSLNLGTLRWRIVPGGLYVYSEVPQCDFGSAEEHECWISSEEDYFSHVEDHYAAQHMIEVTDPAQDLISQEMVKPHVRILKEMLRFTDVHIREAIENILGRGDEVTLMTLMELLVTRQDAVVNVYVGMRKYAFTADVRLVLMECYDFYGRPPSQVEFDYQWNRIKGTGIEHLMNQVAEKNRDNDRLHERARLLDNQVEEGRVRARLLDNQVEEGRVRARLLDNQVEEGRVRARILNNLVEEERVRAEQERVLAEQDRLQVELERARAVQERNRADKIHREKLEVLRDVNTALEAKNEVQELANEAINGIIQEQNRAKVLEVRAEQLEKEKEAERVKAEAERVRAEQLEKEKEAERVKAEQLEKEKEAERVKAEAERVRAEQLEKEKEAERVKAEQLEKEKEAERVKAEAERVKAEAERVKAEAERVKAEAERVRAEQLEKEKEAERVKAEAERVKAEAERVRAEQLEKEKEAERVKAEAERVKAEQLEKEKEAERVKAEAERVKAVRAEAEKTRLIQLFEEEKQKMMAQFEEEKKQLLRSMQQMCVRA